MLLRERKGDREDHFLVWYFLNCVCGFSFVSLANDLLLFVVFGLVESGGDVKKSGMFI